MNCTDVSRILDGCPEATLPRLHAAALDEHISACSDCAEQHASATGLAHFRADVPPLPDSLRATAGQLQQQLESGRERRPTRRPVLLGGLLLLGAAATMFSVIPREEDTATA